MRDLGSETLALERLQSAHYDALELTLRNHQGFRLAKVQAYDVCRADSVDAEHVLRTTFYISKTDAGVFKPPFPEPERDKLQYFMEGLF